MGIILEISERDSHIMPAIGAISLFVVIRLQIIEPRDIIKTT